MELIHRVAEYFREKMGRKGAILAILGLSWILNGYAIANEVALQPDSAQGLFHLALPIWLRVLIWSGTGAVAVLCSGFRPPRYHATGYAVLMFPAAERALSYLAGWIIELVNGQGYPNGWASSIIWFGVVGILLVISGWPEAPHVEAAEERRRE